MLSLNSLSSSNEARIAAEAKPKGRTPEDQKPQADFAAYMAVLSQPVKVDAPQHMTPKANEAPAAEKPAVQNTSAPSQATEAPQTSAQKAGNEASPAENKDTKAEKEVAEVKNAKPQPIRSEKELLETLGLLTKKSGVSSTEGVQRKKATAEEITSTTTAQKAAVVKTDKAQIAATTLQQLQKTPDLILANAEGLKKLGEKLGLAFLGKVTEKLGEKQNKAEATQTHTKAELKTDLLTQTTTAKVQKTGDGQQEQNTGFQNSQKSPKGVPVKIVSRETIAADTAEKPAPLGGSDLKPVSLPETATGRLNAAAQVETRLAESVAHVRASENIRTAVENPLMRADLVRQFNEVMGRAQVLVADSQNAQFSVKLFPRDLGRMEIDLKMVDGEIRGKIVVENEDVKNEMQNFLQQRENSGSEQQLDLNRIDIEVRNGNQHAQNPEHTPDAETIIQSLVTRAAANAYEAAEGTSQSGSGLYA